LLALLRALALDPALSGTLLLYRTARLAVRIVRGRRSPGEGRNFYDVDPAAVLSNDPDALPAFAALIDALEERRLRKLAAAAHS
jgi:hypothetical protein